MSSRLMPRLAIILALISFALPAWSDEPAPLTRDELRALVLDKTADCRKEKDQSTCVNYFSAEGEIAQVLHKDGKRKDGRWFLDDSDRLCILWNGQLKPYCFIVTENQDGSYKMVKKGKHISTILKLYDGNTEKF